MFKQETFFKIVRDMPLILIKRWLLFLYSYSTFDSGSSKLQVICNMKRFIRQREISNAPIMSNALTVKKTGSFPSLVI